MVSCDRINSSERVLQFTAKLPINEFDKPRGSEVIAGVERGGLSTHQQQKNKKKEEREKESKEEVRDPNVGH